MNPLQFFYAVSIGVTISVLGQWSVDWWRRRNAVVSIQAFEELERKFNRLIVKLERQGIETNGD